MPTDTPLPPYPSAAERLALLLLGLGEVREMIRYGDNHGASANDVLTAVTARIFALIEAHTPASEADSLPQ